MAAFALAAVVLAGCAEPASTDPCESVSGACVTLRLRSSSGLRVDAVAVRVDGAGYQFATEERPSGGRAVSLPVALALAFPALGDEPADLRVSVRGRLEGADVGCGGGGVRLGPGAAGRAPLEISLSACGGGGCDDGVRDGGETGADCGGPCPARCPRGEGCATHDDCDGLLCVAGACTPPPDCAALHRARPSLGDGAYGIAPPPGAALVRTRCDMSTEGGGWTLVLKTDAASSNTADKTAAEANPAALSTLAPGVAGAKLADAAIAALLVASGPSAELRVEGIGLPRPQQAGALLVRDSGFAMTPPASYPRNVRTRLLARDAGYSSTGWQCHRPDNPICDSTPDTWCLGVGPRDMAMMTEHVCLRRAGHGGVWFKGGLFDDKSGAGGFYAARVWVR